jgi:hypothetical protein
MGNDWGGERRITAGKVRLREVLKPRKTIIDYTTTSVIAGSIASP